MEAIFYGAGQFAAQNLTKWQENGMDIVCFADKECSKHGDKLLGYTIYSLEEAMRLFPEAKLYLSCNPSAYKIVANYLIATNGLKREDINIPFPDIHYRKGCIQLGTKIELFLTGICTCFRSQAVPYSGDWDKEYKELRERIADEITNQCQQLKGKDIKAGRINKQTR